VILFWPVEGNSIRRDSPSEISAVPTGLVPVSLHTHDYPGFPARYPRQVCVCGFLHGKPREAPWFHQTQEIRVRPGLLSARAVQISGLSDFVGLILLDKRAPRPILAKQVRGDSEWRTYGARINPHRYPALPGWAHIWYRPSGPRKWFSSAVSHAGNS
jgi:hypothetical protein